MIRNYLLGKAWDDRVCVGVCIEVMKALAKEELAVDVYFAATTQEEVGIRGARTAAHSIKPRFGDCVRCHYRCRHSL